MTHTEPTGRRATLSALKSFAEKGHWEIEDGRFGEIISEETDRGLVIIMVSILDDILRFVLERRMRDLSNRFQEKIFGFEGPLATFSARMRIAYAFEIIDKEIYDTLDVLRAMRNACAHSRREISFDQKELSNALSLLFTDEQMRTAVRDTSHTLGKIHFIAMIRYVIARLGGETKETAEKMGGEAYEILREEVRQAREKQKAKAEKRKKPATSPRKSGTR